MHAELVDVMGNDLTVVNSARVSFDKASKFEAIHSGHGPSSTVRECLSVADTKLISYLAKHQHTTPFTHPQITLRETVPIFVARQRFKHVVGFTYNEVSRRYVDSPPEFFIPDVWRSRPEGSVKQGSGAKAIDRILFEDPERGVSDFVSPNEAYEGYLLIAEGLYQNMLDSGVAPEQARMVLPQSMFTSYYVTGSLAAFARAYKQRIDAHAQVEIQELAKQWDALIQPLFPVSWAALTV
jgi:thymidylate synthase (FAD)